MKRPGWGPLADADVGRVFDVLAGRIVPKTELHYASAFELLVAVVLSAQCTDKAVNAATARLFPVANTPQALLALGEAKLKTYIRSIGLFNAKARHIIGLCGALLERHGGEVPSDRAALEALPGVGRKTASVVLNTAFGVPTVAVDTHILRVANRLGICRTSGPDATQAVLESRIPARHLLPAHHYLILHGRYTCMARSPRCGACPVAGICRWPEKPAQPSKSSSSA